MAERRGIERVAELTTEPVVGRFYRVPTVRGRFWRETRAWPVLLPFHDDLEIIGFEYGHYHLDTRFVPDWMLRAAIHRPPVTRQGSLNASPLQVNLSINRDGLPPPVERVRKCRRRMDLRGYEGREWHVPLSAAYADARLKPGMICPHRGVCLASMPVRDGVVECPAHGLRWDVRTGRLAGPAAADREKIHG